MRTAVKNQGGVGRLNLTDVVCCFYVYVIFLRFTRGTFSSEKNSTTGFYLNSPSVNNYTNCDLDELKIKLRTCGQANPRVHYNCIIRTLKLLSDKSQKKHWSVHELRRNNSITEVINGLKNRSVRSCSG